MLNIYLVTIAVFFFTKYTMSQEACPSDFIFKLLPLANNPNLSVCSEDSGYTFVPPSDLPTDEQVALMCASDACHALVEAFQALNLPSCVLTFNGNSVNVKELVDSIEEQCSAEPTPAPTVFPTPAPTDFPTPAPTVFPTPAPTTIEL